MSTACDSYKYSFFPRRIIDWNKLPDKLIMIEGMEQFKTESQTMYLHTEMFLHLFIM